MSERIKTVDMFQRSLSLPFQVEYECPECETVRYTDIDRWNTAGRRYCLVCGSQYEIPADKKLEPTP